MDLENEYRRKIRGFSVEVDQRAESAERGELRRLIDNERKKQAEFDLISQAKVDKLREAQKAFLEQQTKQIQET